MGQLIALVQGLAGCWVGQPTCILNISPVLHPASLFYAVSINGKGQLSCCHAPRAGLLTLIPPGPALLCCSGEAQGQICRVLQLRDRATSLALVTPGTALPPATGSKGQWEPSLLHSQHHIADEGQSSTLMSMLSLSGPAPLSPSQWVGSTVCPGEVQGRLSLQCCSW